MTDPNPATTPRRRHRSRAEADQIAAEYEASGLRCEDFCRQNGVPLKTLSRYVTRYRKQQTGCQPAGRFVAVEVAPPSGPGVELAVLLSTGRRIEVKRGFDATTLRQLVAVLE
jgi:transposase-like protein